MLVLAKAAAFAAILVLTAQPANAATVWRTFEYFNVNGRTAADLDRELNRRGPVYPLLGVHVPGMTKLRLESRINYESNGNTCRVGDATITIHAHVFLPRWKQRRTAPADLAMIWDTLSADIKRHEESHISIARTSAGNLERQIKSLPWRSDCALLKNDVHTLTAKQMKQHDFAQIQFTKVEALNFEDRLGRLLTYRLLREFGKTP